jgi:hypothetical protein
VGPYDTIRFRDGKISSVHSPGELFSDEEIVEKKPIIKTEYLFYKVDVQIPIYYTEHNKPILQQQASRSCTAAATAMLILDHKKNINAQSLDSRNLGNDKDMLGDLSGAGLNPQVINMNNKKDLKELSERIKQNGSAATTLMGRVGAHEVVVDEVSPDLEKIRLRDPYHGWEITVKKEAFLDEWVGTKLIQVTNRL